MSVTFTPTQTWIALILFGATLIFSVYNLFLNIASDQKSEESKQLSEQRSINATKERQLALEKIDKDTLVSFLPL
jgi:hypothetical protein